MSTVSDTLSCKRVSGTNKFKMYVKYTITSHPETRSWDITAELWGARTNKGYVTQGHGKFSLGLNGDKNTVSNKAYTFRDDPVKVLTHSATISETSSGSGKCRFTVTAVGASFEFSLDANVALPIVDVTPPELSAWISGVSTSGATVNAQASHPTYDLATVEYYLDDVLQSTATPTGNTYTGAALFTDVSPQTTHIAKVIVTSGNGMTETVELAFVTEYVPATGVTADPIALTVNETKQATYDLAPTDSNELPHYTVLNSKIATVDSLGYVTGHKIGATTLTIAFDSVSVDVTVTVTRATYYDRSQRTYIRAFDSRESKFNTGGLGTLMPTVCKITEKLNGDYSLTLEHPRDPYGKYLRLQTQNIIECPTPRGMDLFRIKKTDDTDPDKIVVNAEHLTYDAIDNLCRNCKPKNVTGIDAAAQLQKSLVYSSDIAISSDIKTKGTAEWDMINPSAALLGTDEKSFVSIFGGEAYRYRDTLTMRQRIGSDNAFIIRYRKNTSSARMTTDDSKVVTRLYLSGQDSESKVLMLDSPVDADNINDFPHPICEYRTFSDIRVGKKDSDGKIVYKNAAAVKKALKEKGLSLFAEGLNKPSCTLTVNLVMIEETAEFSDYKALLLIGLGDAGKCVLRDGTSVDLRMTEYTYDAIARKYLSVTLGDTRETLIDYINKGAK